MKGEEQHVDALWKSVEKIDAAVLVMRVLSSTTHTGTIRARAKKSRENKFSLLSLVVGIVYFLLALKSIYNPLTPCLLLFFWVLWSVMGTSNN